MIRFLENHSLKNYQTFGLEVSARYFFEFTDLADLAVFFESNKSWKDEKLLILGGGSNILFTENFDGLVIHPNVPGIKVVKEDRTNIWVEAGAGEEWDELVRHCVFSEFGGIENLSHIPGKVGAAPIQNVGAYGCEAGNLIETVRGYSLNNMMPFELLGSECEFAYRNSIFKHKLAGKVIITSVVFKLEKFPEFDLSYGNLAEEVEKLGGENLRNIRQAVINIRSSKLPDVKDTGSAGSFFKNPIVDIKLTEELKTRFPNLPVFPAEEGFKKLAAGWLIDQCGWNGYREGDAGVHDKQALVLVNHGKATGAEIKLLSEKIKQSVFEKFGVGLEPEVTIL